MVLFLFEESQLLYQTSQSSTPDRSEFAFRYHLVRHELPQVAGVFLLLLCRLYTSADQNSHEHDFAPQGYTPRQARVRVGDA